MNFNFFSMYLSKASLIQNSDLLKFVKGKYIEKGKITTFIKMAQGNKFSYGYRLTSSERAASGSTKLSCHCIETSNKALRFTLANTEASYVQSYVANRCNLLLR